MFRAIPSHQKTTVAITIDGAELKVPEHITVAAAILGHARHDNCRCSFVNGETRAPFCFIGVCHECLVEINGVPNQQACLTKVQEGMRINKQLIRQGA